MAIMRKQKINRFTTVDNYFIEDKRLDPEGKGYLLYMLSKPDNWNFSFKNIQYELNVGERNVRTNMKKLESLKYLKRSKLKNDKGTWEWNYYLYEKPYDMVLKMENYPYVHNAHVDSPQVDTVPIIINTNEINTNNQDKIDKYDKTAEAEFKHNFLTKELMNNGYIKKDDSSSFYFDDLFQEYLDGGYTPRELLGAIHYIVPKVISRNFIDDNGDEIKNKYGYFKNAMESNFNKLNNLGKELYPDDPNSPLWEDYFINTDR